MSLPSFMNVFKSKIPGHQLQPGEISLIADLIIIYYALNGAMPTGAQILKAWGDLQL